MDFAEVGPQLILIVVLTLVNAFFASAEMAIVSLNQNKMRLLADGGNAKAALVLKLVEEPTQFLSTIQVGITLAGFFSSAAAATGISGDLGRLLGSIGVPYGEQIALVGVTILLSYVTLVFGELFPKRIALQKAESVALFSVRPILFCQKIAAPFVKLLSLSTGFLLKLTGMAGDELEEKVSREEVRAMVKSGQFTGVEKEMIDGLFSFDATLAQEVMTPRTQVFCIDIEDPLPENLDALLLENYSRVPVYEGEMDHIIGILYLKDLLAAARSSGFDRVDIRGLLHPAYFVPERKKLDELFSELRARKQHMAVLVDEYGGFSGIVTMEDLVEEIVGNIEDEYDEADPDIVQVDQNKYLVKGNLSKEELERKLGLSLDDAAFSQVDTVSGMVTELLGYIPAGKETVRFGRLLFQVEALEERFVAKVLVTVLPEDTLKN